MDTLSHTTGALLAGLSAALLGAACGAPDTAVDPTSETLAMTTLTPISLADTQNVHAFDGLLTSGQPSVAGLEAARALGVKSVLNSRKPDEMAKVGFDERAVVEGLGMSYVFLPWNGTEELTDEVLDQTRAFLRDAPRPALYHCASANRVGAGWAAWRALDEGLELDAAIAEGKQVGMRTPSYEPKVRDYVARRRGPAAR